MQGTSETTGQTGREDPPDEASVALRQKPTRDPVVYSQELALRICNRISLGETVTRICQDEGMPTECSIYDWVRKDKEGFKTIYTEARQLFWERLADEIIDISDDSSNDERTIMRRGQEITLPDHDHINRSRLRVDTRKFILAKRLPKQFGDNIDQDDKQQALAANILDLIKLVTQVARQPVQAHVIEVSPALLEDKK